MASEKRLIAENDIYALFGRNGKAELHVAHIDLLPRVDAVEVVHGRWEDVQETEMYVPDMKFTITKTAETCSECKARIGFAGPKLYLFDAICPSCGAKMDGERKDNERKAD